MWQNCGIRSMMDMSLSPFLCLMMLVDIAVSNDLARGWNDAIDWVKLDDGLKLAKEQQKPLMVIIHKSWCGACKALKPNFAVDKTIEELSSEFIMVNVEDEEEPSDSQYRPDGGYIPRIFFLDPAGKVDVDIYNEQGSDAYKYYYSSANAIVSGMEKAIKKYGQNREKSKNEL